MTARPPTVKSEIDLRERLRRKRMTAITAFQCHDGLVMAADTEETYPDNKAYSFKLFPVERDDKRLCVSGAGGGYLIDYAKDQIVAALDAGIADMASFEIRLREVMRNLYEKEFPLYPVDHESERQIQLLVGAQFKGRSAWFLPSLFECQSNLVTKLTNVAQRGRILGSGEVLKETVAQFARWGLDVELAELVSFYIMYEAKRNFSGVGGKTHVFTMRRDGTTNYYTGRHLRERESVLDGFRGIAQLLLFALEPSVSENKANDFVDTAKKWIKDMRRYLQKVESGKVPSPTLITIQNRESLKMMRKLKSLMPSASRKGEPEQ